MNNNNLSNRNCGDGDVLIGVLYPLMSHEFPHRESIVSTSLPPLSINEQ